MQRLPWLTFLLVFMTIPSASADRDGSQQPLVVGRISHIEGELLRYVPENEDWVATVKDTPVGKDDVLYADKDAKAELIIPNNNWIRIGRTTQIQIVTLEDDATTIDMDSGIARFYNKSSTVVLKVTTPFGFVTAPPHTTFDVYLKDESVEVIAQEGSVILVHVTDGTEYEIIAGSSSIIAGYQEITSGRGEGDDNWSSWNTTRDTIWEKRLEVKGDSAKYLPEKLYYESYQLEENGVWESVYYEGRYRYFWRPVYISSGWSPFTVGRWTLWYGDHCWVPYEPFGYITHHYGNWVYINRTHCWYWDPPVCEVSIGGGPFFSIAFAWYPGRVVWIHRGAYLGWIPLAPYERYYCRRYWGPRSVVIKRSAIINVKDYRYKNHAVIINRSHLYNVDHYNKVRISHPGNDSIINSYRGAAVINSRVIRDFEETGNRFNFRNSKVARKPHRSVTSKVQHTMSHERKFVKERKSMVQTRPSKIASEKTLKSSSIQTPGVTDRFIPVRGVKSSAKIKKGMQKAVPEVRPLRRETMPRTKPQRLRPQFNSQQPIARITPRAKAQRSAPRQEVLKSIRGSRFRMK